MLSIAGYPTVLSTAEIADWLAANIPPEEIFLWDGRAWPGPGLAQAAWPTSFRPLPPVRIGEFRWPTGAARWGSLHVLADSQLTDLIRAAAFGQDGTQNNPLAVHIDSADPRVGPAVESIDTTMRLLPPYTLGRIPPVGGTSFNGLFLLTLVDDRFFWQGIPCPEFGIPDSNGGSSGAVDWTDLFDLCNVALGLSPALVVDPIPPEYLRPSPTLNLEGEVIGPVLDILCANVGLRFVRFYNGLCWAMNAQTALNLRQIDDQGATGRTLRAGDGDRFLDTL